MISIGELKELIYRETGYRLQVHDNDPILSTFYVNLATLGEALKHAERIQTATKDVINSLPGAADKEMQRAGNEVIQRLSADVGRIAQRLAGNAAAAEKAKAISAATKWAGIGVIVCAVVFGGTGFFAKLLADEAYVMSVRQELEKSREEVVSARAQAKSEIEASQKELGWQGTEQGRLAKKFFDSGAGMIAATCNSSTWEIVKNEDGRFCVPKRRSLSDLFGDEVKYGWKIP